MRSREFEKQEAIPCCSAKEYPDFQNVTQAQEIAQTLFKQPLIFKKNKKTRRNIINQYIIVKYISKI